MFSDPTRMRESRVFARAVDSGTAPPRLVGEPANDSPSRERIAARLIAAYKAAEIAAGTSRMQAPTADLWTGIVAEHMPQLIAMLDSSNAPALAAFLRGFGSEYTWFGGLTLGLDGYFRARDAVELSLLYADKLACLAEAVGAAPRECPEQGDYGILPTRPADELIAAIEQAMGISIEPARGVAYTAGLQTKHGPLNYRHLNAVYAARLAAGNGRRICEFGAGLGLTAMYAKRMGAVDYTIFDLPLVNVIAGNYLLCALGENGVSLFGERPLANTVRVLPFWMCCEEPAQRFDVALNQDSFPEIDEALVRRYLKEIARTTVGSLISINQEARAPMSGATNHVWVAGLLSGDERFFRIRRSPYWMREGYVEEIYRIVGDIGADGGSVVR